MDDDEGTSRSYDSEDIESREEYDPWLGDGDSSDDDESRANVTLATVTHVDLFIYKGHLLRGAITP